MNYFFTKVILFLIKLKYFLILLKIDSMKRNAKGEVKWKY